MYLVLVTELEFDGPVHAPEEADLQMEESMHEPKLGPIDLREHHG